MYAELTIEELSAAIKERAQQLGFAGCGFSKAEALPEDKQQLEKWLQKGYHAGMEYMTNHFEKRCDPTLLVDGAKTVISLLYNYYTDQGPGRSRGPQSSPNMPTAKITTL